MRKILILLSVLGLLVLSGCKTTKEKEADQQAVATAQRTEMDAATRSAAQGQDNNFDEFMTELRQAVALRNMQVIASLMTPNFGYRFNPLGEGKGVFQYWDQINVWDELQLVLNDDFVPFNGFMVSPPEFADPNIPYSGYRAGIMKQGGRWRFGYFVKD